MNSTMKMLCCENLSNKTDFVNSRECCNYPILVVDTSHYNSCSEKCDNSTIDQMDFEKTRCCTQVCISKFLKIIGNDSKSGIDPEALKISYLLSVSLKFEFKFFINLI